MVNIHWPTAVAGKADNVSSVSASACHIDGPIGVNPGELALVYGTRLIFFEAPRKQLILTLHKYFRSSKPICLCVCSVAPRDSKALQLQAWQMENPPF